MKSREPYFKYNKQQRSGIFFLLCLIIVLQGAYYYIKAKPFSGTSEVVIEASVQARLNSIAHTHQKDSITLFPFNPNYITDYKGYRLGMSPGELDRLFAYRKQQKFINSAAEFQQVTQISDSLLAAISPYFKFPEWVQNQKEAKRKKPPSATNTPLVKDLNAATAKELATVNGIGEVLSQRIVKFRDKLGGFLVNEQLYDVYGVAPEVVRRILKHFQVQQLPTIKRININTATAEELSRVLYINYTLAKRLVGYRNVNGLYTSWDELRKVEGFPMDRIERIKLYLAL